VTKVHRIAAEAEAEGALVRPNECEECGRDVYLVKHHKDYSKPLEVAWMCIPCHSKWHVDNPDIKNPETIRSYLVTISQDTMDVLAKVQRIRTDGSNRPCIDFLAKEAIHGYYKI